MQFNLSTISTGATSSVIIDSHGKTSPIPVGRGTIQGDTLSPFLFLIFLEPLLRWLKQGNRGYNYGCLNETENLQCNATAVAFADDLALMADTLPQLKAQYTKLQRVCIWAGLPLSACKCAVTGILHKAAVTRVAKDPCNDLLMKQQFKDWSRLYKNIKMVLNSKASNL